jgi:3-hydroxyisobutyrate dehydrogenase-like beta-hydroxyacid dehydrogenase
MVKRWAGGYDSSEMAQPTHTIAAGFIGLGIMGGAMAGRLLAAGVPLHVFTRTKARAEPLITAGAVWANSPAAVTADADVVFVCVTDTPDVQAVLFGPAGVAAGARPGTIVVDHSTISPGATRRFAADLASRGVTLLDAPVSGGDIGARNGTLSIMVGGDAGALDRVRPLLAHMGKTITHCGPSGAGQLTKLVNQVLVSVTNLAVCEAMHLATAGGLDPATTIAAVGGGAAASWQLANLAAKMTAGDFAPGFMVDLQRKDLRLVLAAADEAGVDLKAVARVNGLFDQLSSEGRGRDGTQALYDMVRGGAEKS